MEENKPVFESSSCSMISLLTNLEKERLSISTTWSLHNTKKISPSCCNRRCKQMFQFAQKSTEKGARNSAEDSVCVLSSGGDAPQGTAQHQQLLLAHQRPQHRLSSQGRMQHYSTCLGPLNEAEAGEIVVLPAESERLLRSCRRRWEVCTASEIMKEDRIFSKILQGPEHPTVQMEEHSESVFIGLGKGDSRDGKGWKLVISDTRREAAAPPADQQLQSRFDAMVAGEGLGALFRAALEPPEPKSHGSTRRKW